MNHRPPFRILRQPLLVDGMMGINAAGEWAILLDSEQSEAEQVVTLWHEVLHALLLGAGIPFPHDEERIEAVAQKLAQACPEILRVCGLASVVIP